MAAISLLPSLEEATTFQFARPALVCWVQLYSCAQKKRDKGLICRKDLALCKEMENNERDFSQGKKFVIPINRIDQIPTLLALPLLVI